MPEAEVLDDAVEMSAALGDEAVDELAYTPQVILCRNIDFDSVFNRYR